MGFYGRYFGKGFIPFSFICAVMAKRPRYLSEEEISKFMNDQSSPIDIAIEEKQINIINAIAEMLPHLLADRKIDNKESSAMYDWAVKTKEIQCDKKDD
ncbi:hypothetical protein AVEN_94712-1 [Araneus ventricosus]|uniref:Uncharacterized protein n=1 Tax=Araneus ventricosus TaxID=182803 RepID=A0A4Y2CM19_ARAVE|nr:hypothetical protein AVEN_94712-1 [Araneus ventricosus]